MTYDLGSYANENDYDLGSYNFIDGRNQWLPNGSSYITAPNAIPLTGDIYTITATDLNIEWGVASRTIFDQGISSNRDLSVLFFSPGFISIYYKNQYRPAPEYNLNTAFPNGIFTGKLTVVIRDTLGTWSLFVDDVEVYSGAISPPAANASGGLVRIGGIAATDNINDTDTVVPPPLGWRVGNVTVNVDGSDVVDYVMPTGTATNVPDIAGGNDGTLREGTGDGSDWGEILTAENTASSSTTEAGQILGGLMPGNSASSASTNNLGVMSTALISGLDSQSASRSEFGSMVSQIIFGANEVSASTAQLGTMTTEGFISGLSVTSGSTTEAGELVTAVINASDSLSLSTTVQGVMSTALISGLSTTSASNTEFGILTTIKYKSNRIMVIGA